jgi:DNA invertase Pin-like site-specific DNA recombinase
MENEMKPGVPVLLFARVSGDDQDYAYQLRELTDYCTKQGYAVVHTIANNLSGRTGKKRPDLEELFRLARGRRFRKVVVTSIERLGRDARTVRRTIDALHDLGISVVFKAQGIESLNEAGQESFVTNIIISVYAEMGQEDNRQRSQKIRSGLANAKAKGAVLGRPEGWRKDEEALLREYAKLARDLKAGLSLNQCMKLHGLSKNTVIKVRRALAGE